MRVGISTGEPIIGLVGQRRQTHTAIGDTVNLASRIQEICTPGLVTIDSTTYQEVERYVNIRRKAVFSDRRSQDPKFIQEISDNFKKLQENPDDVAALKEVGSQFLKHDDVLQAHEYLSRALEIDPDDDELKLAYAEASMKVNQMDAVKVRARKIECICTKCWA